MYDQPRFLTEKTSNNAFNFDRRAIKKLYIPMLREGTVADVKTGQETVFEDFDDNDRLHTCKGLEHFVFTHFGKAPTYIFDNHNHAFAFWCLEKSRGTIADGALLVHIDQHKDTRIPDGYLSKEDAQKLENVDRYTNSVLNVGNFIPAAQHIGLVKDIIFLDSQYSLEELKVAELPDENLMLDIDLDFFAPDSDYIGNDLKLKVIEQLLPKASIITFATSPYFIDQQRAIGWLNRIAELVKV